MPGRSRELAPILAITKCLKHYIRAWEGGELRCCVISSFPPLRNTCVSSLHVVSIHYIQCNPEIHHWLRCEAGVLLSCD